MGKIRTLMTVAPLLYKGYKMYKKRGAGRRSAH